MLAGIVEAGPYGNKRLPTSLNHRDQAMTHCITTSDQQRQQLLHYYRTDPHPDVRKRCHIILLLDDGYTWQTIETLLFCSTRTISRWRTRFRHGGVPALRGYPRGAPRQHEGWWAYLVVAWVTQQTPRAFGFVRSRWCCAVIVLLLWRRHHVCVSRETVRRWLHEHGLVWRRPRPVLRRADPDKPRILQDLRQLLSTLPDDETVVFQDEVAVHLNPDIGAMWMAHGQQAHVETPGDTKKRYLAGSLHWRTGTLIETFGRKRNSQLFVAHLDQLRRSLRRYRRIHVIVDNARFHDSTEVALWYGKWHGRVKLHFLPKYAPELNPIERVWWHLREEITRNHTCSSIEELIELTMRWLQDRKPFAIEGSAYSDLSTP